MSYILPIPHYQYADYQKRVTENKNDRIFIDRPFKVILETQYDEVIGKETEHFKAAAPKPEKTYVNPRQAQAIAGLTGKGVHFSELV